MSKVIPSSSCHGFVWFECWSGEVLAKVVATSAPSVSYIHPLLFTAECFQGQEAQLDKPLIYSTRTHQEYVFISILSSVWCQLALSSLGPYHQTAWSSITGWPYVIIQILTHPRDRSWPLPCRSIHWNGVTAALNQCYPSHPLLPLVKYILCLKMFVFSV